MDTEGTASDAARGWGWRHASSFAGLLLLVAWLPFYAFVSLIAPEWVVVPALLVWLCLLVVLLRWFKPHPGRALCVGLSAVVLWYVAGYAFDALLGWTA